MSRVAIYLRVSTNEQTTMNQRAELEAWAARAGHDVVAVFEDHGISGAKGRDKRPGFDRMLKAATRREFDMLAVWSTDRLGRSMQHVLDVLMTLRDTGTALFIHTQGLDTSTAAGRAMFQMLGVFAELERELITERVHAGIKRAKAEGKHCGRPSLASDTLASVRDALVAGQSVRAAAKAAGVGLGTVARVRADMLAAGQLAA